MSSFEAQAIATQAARSFAFVVKVRAGAVLVFVPLVAALAIAGVPGWAPYLLPLGPFALFALGCLWFRRRSGLQRIGAYSFLVDVTVIFELQRRSLETSPFPAGVAGFTLGLFALFVLLAGASMRHRATLLTAGLASVLQVALMQLAGVGVGAQVAAVVVLLSAGVAQASITSRLVTMVRSAASLEVAHRLETERAEKLTQAHATIASLYQDAETRNEQLVRLNADKELLTSLLVHDLRAPLSAVKANLDWLKGEVAALNDADVTEAVAESRQVTVRLTGMIGDLLNISKLEANALPLNLEPVKAKSMLETLGRQFSAQARSRKISVLVDAPDVSFDADQALLVRVLENLASNALRYAPPAGRVLLEARADDEGITFSVRNDGTPIPPHVRPGLFDKFTQGGDSTENRRVGWGLGLYFCKLSVASHGGTISVEDVDGWPTSFVVRLPRVRQRLAA